MNRRHSHWFLALALVIFMQVSTAAHNHIDEPPSASHDCVLCSQQQQLDHLHINEGFSALPLASHTLVITYHFDLVVIQVYRRPPVRGPPALLNA